MKNLKAGKSPLPFIPLLAFRVPLSFHLSRHIHETFDKPRCEHKTRSDMRLAFCPIKAAIFFLILCWCFKRDSDHAGWLKCFHPSRTPKIYIRKLFLDIFYCPEIRPFANICLKCDANWWMSGLSITSRRIIGQPVGRPHRRALASVAKRKQGVFYRNLLWVSRLVFYRLARRSEFRISPDDIAGSSG